MCAFLAFYVASTSTIFSLPEKKKKCTPEFIIFTLCQSITRECTSSIRFSINTPCQLLSFSWLSFGKNEYPPQQTCKPKATFVFLRNFSNQNSQCTNCCFQVPTVPVLKAIVWKVCFRFASSREVKLLWTNFESNVCGETRDSVHECTMYILPCPVYLILFMRDMCEESENKAIHLLLPQNRNAISPLHTCPLN